MGSQSPWGSAKPQCRGYITPAYGRRDQCAAGTDWLEEAAAACKWLSFLKITTLLTAEEGKKSNIKISETELQISQGKLSLLQRIR